MSPRALLPLLLMLAAPLLPGQVDRTSGQGEFPALQLLPPGSEVKGISLPRYQEHRVTAHIMADLLKVLSRYEVHMTGIHTVLYSEEGEATTVRMKRADYDFRTSIMVSEQAASVEHPRFSARGEAVTFNSETRTGLLKGPVYTTLNTSLLSQPPTTPKK